MDNNDSNKKKSAKLINRRNFMATTGAVAAGVGLSGLSGCNQKDIDKVLRSHFLELTPDQIQTMLRELEQENREKYSNPNISIDANPAMKGVHFAYGLDISRCIGCRRCVHACVNENNQSRDPMIEWIRVLEFKKETAIDFAEANPYYCSPASVHEEETAEENKKRLELPYDSHVTDTQKAILKNPVSQYPLYREPTMAPANSPCTVPREGHFYVPVACQQCENPPCVKVCPTKATWKEEDGIVVIDYDWCIGCRYCMAACPYGARHFNWSEPKIPNEDINPNMHYLGNRPRMRGVVEKCTFCIQRTRKGQYPACVEICPVGSRKFGNLLDPKSEIRYIMEHKRVLILKNELGTRPKFFYFYGI